MPVVVARVAPVVVARVAPVVVARVAPVVVARIAPVAVARATLVAPIEDLVHLSPTNSLDRQLLTVAECLSLNSKRFHHAGDP